jgi:AcrR family transcriptional regulator
MRAFRNPGRTAGSVDGRSDSVTRLLEAAEQVIAVDGLQHATDQAIVRAAGHRNHSAVAYHFGNRDALVLAVWEFRNGPIDRYRARLLADIERRQRLDDLNALVSAYVLPLVRDVASRRPSYWARFNEAHLRNQPLEFVPSGPTGSGLESFERPVSGDTVAQVFRHQRRLAAGGSEPFASRRVSIGARLVIGTLAAWERDQEAGRDSPSPEDFAQELSELVVALLARPPAPVQMAGVAPAE